MKKIRIFVADDHTVVRMGLVTLLETERDIIVVGEAGDGEAAVEAIRRTRPDAVLMDIAMPRKDGIEAARIIKRELPATRILILTSFSGANDLAKAVAAGADGVMLKNSDYSEVAEALRKVSRGETAIAPEVRKMLAENLPSPKLTQRQLDILESMARGLTNSDIAKQFGITPDGVKFHITSILARLDAANRSEAVAIALKRQLLK
ncbi:MAG: response regulator transcription factor, partial [Kiritimatiellae bacterium]|nr:response regulator transcription factor [Kiritimatiellia bacterium]